LQDKENQRNIAQEVISKGIISRQELFTKQQATRARIKERPSFVKLNCFMRKISLVKK